MKLNDNQLSQLNTINEQYLKLSELLTYEEVVLDKKLCYKLEKDQLLVKPIALKFQEFNELNNSFIEYKALLKSLNKDEQMAFNIEIEAIETKLNSVQDELIKLLSSTNASMQNIIVEIVADKNSVRLSEDILKGYTAFCNNNNFTMKVEAIKNTTFLTISGLNAKEYFSKEIGIHCSINELCQVYVYDAFDKDKFTFNDEDISVAVCRSSGAGGQHINTTDSAIKITHLLTGITAVCQSERSQIQNREKALNTLKEKVNNYYTKLKSDHITNAKKEQIKLIRNNFVAKNYNYESGNITLNNKDIIKLSDFLHGKAI